MVKPVKGQVYNLAEIFKLDLKDDPCLLVPTPTSLGMGSDPVQTSHIGDDWWLLHNPIAMAQLRFTYTGTTDEWVPVFYCQNPYEECKHHFNYEVELTTLDGGNEWWVTPRHYPRQQHSWWDADKANHLVARHDPDPRDSYPATAKVLELLQRFPELAPH